MTKPEKMDVAQLMIERAGFSPSEKEMEGLVLSCRNQAAAMRQLYAMTETKYASPATVLDPAPAPQTKDWED